MTYDVARIRKDFPLLDREVRPGVPLVYLDNAATSQKPQAVLDAMRDYYEQHNANVHRGIHTLAEEATALYEGARDKVAAFVNAADRAEVVFTKNSSEALNLLSYVLPLGPGLHAFNTVDEAAEAVGMIERDYAKASAHASEVAREYFAGDRVLGSMLALAG